MLVHSGACYLVHAVMKFRGKHIVWKVLQWGKICVTKVTVVLNSSSNSILVCNIGLQCRLLFKMYNTAVFI